MTHASDIKISIEEFVTYNALHEKFGCYTMARIRGKVGRFILWPQMVDGRVTIYGRKWSKKYRRFDSEQAVEFAVEMISDISHVSSHFIDMAGGTGRELSTDLTV